MSKNVHTPAVYAYVRWSTDAQDDGDSRARQEGYVADWLRRNTHRAQWDVSLGERGYFRDEGKSGHLRTSLDGYALGEFLALCKSKRVQPGSFLLTENLDRVTREHPWEALRLIDSILRFGVVLVQLSPEKEFRDRLEFSDIVVVSATAERAFQESDKKRDRCGKAWQALKRNAAEGAVMTTNVPAWCVVVGRKRVGTRSVGGTIKLDAEKAATVRRLFGMSIGGKGCPTIAEELNDDGTPVVGRSKLWDAAVVHNILTNPAVHGEYHPHTGVTGSSRKGKPRTRKPTGDVVPDYYPAVIDRERFLLAQDSIASRVCFRGRRGKHINLFAGLLIDARDGGPFTYRHTSTRPPTILPAGAKSGRGSEWSCFNGSVFDSMILSELIELKAADVLPESDGGDVARLSALHTAKHDELEQFRKDIDEEPRLLKSLKGTLVRLQEECDNLAEELAKAQRVAASPLAETWGEFQSVARLLEKDGSDEMRLRCRNALRRLVESVTCLFTGTKMTRIAAVRVQFNGTPTYRDYVIVAHSRNGTRKNPPAPAVKSVRWEGGLDLRTPSDARRVQAWLSSTDLPGLLAAIEAASRRDTLKPPVPVAPTRKRKKG